MPSCSAEGFGPADIRFVAVWLECIRLPPNRSEVASHLDQSDATLLPEHPLPSLYVLSHELGPRFGGATFSPLAKFPIATGNSMFSLRILPAATVVCSLAVNALWIGSIGFVLFKLARLALSLA
jgi:hypothetical protein